MKLIALLLGIILSAPATAGHIVEISQGRVSLVAMERNGNRLDISNCDNTFDDTVEVASREIISIRFDGLLLDNPAIFCNVDGRVVKIEPKVVKTSPHDITVISL